jgi:hypothetical protein
MHSAAYDLVYFKAALDSLEEYLLSKELYWPAGAPAPSGEPPFPAVTPGGIVLARARLLARKAGGGLSLQQVDAFSAAAKRFDETIARWRVAWENKAGADYQARLKLWRDFVEEYRKKPEAHYDRYGYEVERRAELDLLEGMGAAVAPVQVELLLALDGVLRGLLLPGPFVWEAAVAGGFPSTRFWYLYGTPVQVKQS